MKQKRFNVELSDDAENDFDKSYRHYSEISKTIAENFFHQVNISLEGIKDGPKSFPLIYQNTRKCIVKKFPFVIYFQFDEALIKVIAIFHTSRNPVIWNERIS